MSATTEARSSGPVHGQQSDDDYQRHNADRHRREGSGQDRFGQKALIDDPHRILYMIVQRVGDYCVLQSVGKYGPRSGQWVNVMELEDVCCS